MNIPIQSFAFAPAVRTRVSLIIAIAGASGGGKTLSALKIGRGLCGGNDSRIAVIDTEAGRANHYAVAPGEKPTADRFAFQYGDLRAPFSPEAYTAAIAAADDAGRFDVVIVDSSSHEYEGDGGLHDIHDALVADAVEKARASHNASWGEFDPVRAAERVSIGAWREPKSRHKRWVSRLLQCRAHMILCLRAEEKIRIEKIKDERGRERTVIVQPSDMKPEERWVPICEKRFMYEMTLSLIVTPQNPGVPIPIKLQQQHRAAVPLDRPLDEATGRALAEWASGGAPASGRPPTAAAEPPASPGSGAIVPGDAGPPAAANSTERPDLERRDQELAAAALLGTAALMAAWRKLPRQEQALLKSALDRRHKVAAKAADEAALPL